MVIFMQSNEELSFLFILNFTRALRIYFLSKGIKYYQVTKNYYSFLISFSVLAFTIVDTINKLIFTNILLSTFKLYHNICKEYNLFFLVLNEIIGFSTPYLIIKLRYTMQNTYMKRTPKLEAKGHVIPRDILSILYLYVLPLHHSYR